MGKEHYIEQLKEQLHEIMERPVTLGRAEEVTVYAGTPSVRCAAWMGTTRPRALPRTTPKHGRPRWRTRTARLARTGRWVRRTPWPISQVSA